MGKFQGNYLTPARYRDGYIAAEQKVRRLRSRVEGVKTKMMLGDVEDPAELEKAQEELAEAQREADRLHCLWTTGKEPGAAAMGIVWRNSLGKVIGHEGGEDQV